LLWPVSRVVWVINLVSDWSPRDSQSCEVQSQPTCSGILRGRSGMGRELPDGKLRPLWLEDGKLSSIPGLSPLSLSILYIPSWQKVSQSFFSVIGQAGWAQFLNYLLLEKSILNDLCLFTNWGCPHGTDPDLPFRVVPSVHLYNLTLCARDP